jgi:glycosyltransferase involved in cell wall biosynthesis
MAKPSNFYLERYAFRSPQIQAGINPNTGIIVVIPCHDETGIEQCLNGLAACEQPETSVEIIVVVNCSEAAATDSLKLNEQTVSQIETWSEAHANFWLTVHALPELALPKKHAGVGLARKIGMDEAVDRLDVLGNEQGLIVCYDADCLCTPNYFIALENHFAKHPKTPGCSIHFEHPLSGDEYDPTIYEGIEHYELFLRYYNQAQRFTGYPGAHHTVGSSMAVRSWAYQSQGGMNRRKAGEDFYFIHKIIGLGEFTELKDAMVIPSPRTSHRVPFGTGKAMQDWMDEADAFSNTYAFQSYLDVKDLYACISTFFTEKMQAISHLSEAMQDFLKQSDFDKHLDEIRSNSKTYEAFSRRFYAWFNAFKIMKYLHFARDHHYPQVPLLETTNLLLDKLGHAQCDSIHAALMQLRNIERK